MQTIFSTDISQTSALRSNTEVELNSGKHSHINKNVKELKLDVKKNKKEALKAILEDAFETPSTKAIFKIILTPFITLKLFLFTFLIASTVYSSYLVIMSIMDYLEYGVTTTSRTFYETSPLFPKVTFCNLNPFTTEYAYNLTQKGSLYNLYLSDDEKRMLSHDFSDILVDCMFNSVYCDSTYFTRSYDSWYGNCFTFNSGLDSYGNKTQFQRTTIAGGFFGLRVILYVNFFEKLFNSVYFETLGAIVRIGNNSYMTSYPGLSGVLVGGGSSVNIVVEREFKSILPKPYSNCGIDSNSPSYIQGLDFYNLIVQSNYKYTQQLCFLQCYQNYLFKKYNCTDVLLFSLYNATPCSIEVNSKITTLNENFDESFINKHCILPCPLECDQLLYKTSSSYSQIVGYSFLSYFQSKPNIASDFINRTLDTQTVKESLVSVNVFYDNFAYTLTKESPQWDAISLLGSIGGNLGLFLGVSVFSISELIVLAIDVYFTLKK
jgi:hypothetical protein